MLKMANFGPPEEFFLDLKKITPWLQYMQAKAYSAARHYSDIGKQLSLANNTNRLRGAVLGLSQDGACTNSFEFFR